MKDYWREKAQEAIAEVVEKFSMKHNLSELTDFEKRELRIRIDAAFPLDFRSRRLRNIWREEKGKTFDRYALNQSSLLPQKQLALFADFS